MAALVAGVQYGLSSHSNFHENKSLIFVKLTDSAQRAIEDYLRNRSKINQNPTIQFLGNEGKLCFPTSKSSYGNFTFSLSSNQDIEGPQGGFECVQQTGPKNLESLGTLPCKMRIQANDDVYETTRHRMHVAEENNKNKCTRVIKANEPIDRKVKVKGTMRTIPPPSNSNSSTILRYRESSNFPSSVTQSSKLSSSPKAASGQPVNRSLPDIQKKLNDIMRRPLKERLIHLLALRPFKRPELYDRINREGVREKEKNVMATVLKQIAFMRDNTYHLHRCVWNDVQEDWPFYTEQEKAMLKRRKPQNLTPPGSSDGGSSGSGQSPNSTHPGSPPAIAAPPPGLLGPKRPGYYQGNDGLPTKRQRISHYRKPEPSNSTLYVDNTRPNDGLINSWDQKHLQRQQRYQHQRQNQQHQQLTNCTAAKLDLTTISDGEEVSTDGIIKIDASSDILLSGETSHIMHSHLGSNNQRYQQQQQQYQEREQPQECSTGIKNDTKNNEDENSDSASVEFNDQDSKERETEQHNGSELSFPLRNSSSAKSLSSFASGTVEDSFLSFSTSPCNRMSPVSSESFRNTEYPDYLTYYTTISSSEQRTRYKAEFNAYYKEYRKLHVQVVKISKQFSQLEEELKQKLDAGNTDGYEAIKHQILQEYARTKNVNARFYYLHDKLGHIKKLVSEYDAQVHISSSTHINSKQTISSDHGNDSSHLDVSETRCNFIKLPEDQTITFSAKMSHIS